MADNGSDDTTRIRFSPTHKGHTDANKRVGGKKVRDKGGHHQEQSPGYDGTEAQVPVRHSGG